PDLIVTAGYDPVEYAPGLWNPERGKTIVHLDFTAAEVDAYYQPAVEVVADVREALDLLREQVTVRRDPGRSRALHDWIVSELEAGSTDAGYPLKPQRILHDLRRVLGGGDILISDVGAHKLWVARLYQAMEPNTVIISNGFAAMGIALPGAIAAKLLYPDRKVVAVSGDGGFLMNCQELETAVRLGLAFVVLLFRDDGYGSISCKQLSRYVRESGLSICTPYLSGLAAAFLIAAFTRCLTRPAPAKGGPTAPRILIIAPTRELVVQIEADAQLLGAHTGLGILAVYGGIDYNKQRDALRERCDVLVGTPGRLIDYLKQHIWSPSRVEVLVIDEADRMFDMGFIADLRFILRRLPKPERRQSFLFSATLSFRVLELTWEFMNNPSQITIMPQQKTAERVEQTLYHVGREEKFPLLLGLMRREGDRFLIFSNTREESRRLEDRLIRNGWDARAITGDVDQKRRLRL